MKALMDWVTSKGTFRESNALGLGLLVLRVAGGLIMAINHGQGKFNSFGDRMDSFPDPLGVSSPVSMALTVFAEFFCGLALAAGFLSRAVAIPMAITMLVAVLVIHIDDPFKKQELALLYLAPYLTILLVGPGKFSIDFLLFEKK